MSSLISALSKGKVGKKPDIFEPIYFFVQSRVNRALNHSGERFQTNTVPVQPGFTGFVWTQGRFV